jgi:uncharacterized membrane protein YedE/YeeE
MVHWVWGDIIASSIGGFLIGTASTLHFAWNGKLNGCGGVVDAFTGKGKGGNFGWKFSYFAGMIIASMIVFLAAGRDMKLGDYEMIFFDPEIMVSKLLPWYSMAIGGFLVGIGMRLGRGCTSGHGINGIPSLSPGSFIGICLFMVFGMAFANLCRFTDFLREGEDWGEGYTDFRKIMAYVLFGLTIAVQIFVTVRAENKKEMGATFVVGCLFGLGLVISGMCRVSKVLGFLTFDKNWDPSLAFVMGVGVGMNMFTFRYIRNNMK